MTALVSREVYWWAERRFYELHHLDRPLTRAEEVEKDQCASVLKQAEDNGVEEE